MKKMDNKDERKYCIDCGVELDEETGCNEIEEDQFVCDECYDNYGHCDLCGSIVPVDELEYWGDCQLCPDCMEENAPSYDEDENEEETAVAYEAMRERLLGRQTKK